MAKKPTPAGDETARSQLMAMAEKLAEMGIKKAIISYISDDHGTGMMATEGMNTYEMVFALRQSEHFIFTVDNGDDEDDIGDED
jgi:hypothetical protein